MEIHLKIKDVIGQDEQKRHIILVDNEEFKNTILEHEGFLLQEVIKEYFMRHKTKFIADLLDDSELRNTIYMQEKAKREAKSEQRERHRLFEIERRRIQEQHRASINYRKNVDFIHDILGWNDGEL